MLDFAIYFQVVASCSVLSLPLINDMLVIAKIVVYYAAYNGNPIKLCQRE